MRSYTVYGTVNGEEHYAGVAHNPSEGKVIHQQMQLAGVYDTIRVKDCLGGIQFERNLRTGEKIQ